ncbi:MAG: hypothetical protein V4596_01895 [Bdellovibrionota bacterium]
MSSKDLLNEARKRQISPDEFLKRLWKLSTGQKRQAIRFLPTQTKPTRIFRSRIFNKGVLPVSVSELTYPPIDKATLGRANSPNKSIFYASAGGPTTFVESKCKVQDTLVLSEYRIYDPYILNPIGSKRVQTPMSDFEILLNEIFTFPGEYFYEYSSKVAEHLLGGEDINGLIYPSIAGQNESENIVLKPKFVDQFLKLINTTAYHITGIPQQHKYDVEEFDFGIPQEDKISWKKRRKNWSFKYKGQMLKMISNGWSWEAFDEKDMLVDPH